MTKFQIQTMKKLEQAMVYSIRILDAMTNPMLDDITRQRLAIEALDYVGSIVKGGGK